MGFGVYHRQYVPYRLESNCSLWESLTQPRSLNNFNVDDMKRKFSRAAHTMRIWLSSRLAESYTAAHDITGFAPLCAHLLLLHFVAAEPDGKVVVAVRMKERRFTSREQNIEHTNVLVLKYDVVMWFLFDRHWFCQVRGSCSAGIVYWYRRLRIRFFLPQSRYSRSAHPTNSPCRE